MVLYHFNRYLLGWFQRTYVLITARKTFIIALANYVVSQDVRITFRPDIFLTIDDINYQLNSSIYVATGCHCYVALIKTDIHLTAVELLVHREIQLIGLTPMTYSKARAPELRLITRDSF